MSGRPAPGIVVDPYITAPDPDPSPVGIWSPTSYRHGRHPDVAVVAHIVPPAVIVEVGCVFVQLVGKIAGALAPGVETLVPLHVPPLPVIRRAYGCEFGIVFSPDR